MSGGGRGAPPNGRTSGPSAVLAVVAALALLGAAASPALAAAKPKAGKGAAKGTGKGKPPADPSVAEAKAHFYEGEKLYKAKRFADALAEYTRSYELAALPAILFNIAQCHRNLGAKEEAVAHFRRYLEAAPAATNRADVEIVIRGLEDELAKERARKAAEEEESRRLAAAALPPPPGVEGDGPGDEEVAGGKKSVFGRWWFWTIVGGVVIAGGAASAGVLFLGGGARPDQVIDHR